MSEHQLENIPTGESSASQVLLGVSHEEFDQIADRPSMEGVLSPHVSRVGVLRREGTPARRSGLKVSFSEEERNPTMHRGDLSAKANVLPEPMPSSVDLSSNSCWMFFCQIWQASFGKWSMIAIFLGSLGMLAAGSHTLVWYGATTVTIAGAAALGFNFFQAQRITQPPTRSPQPRASCS